MSKRKGSNTSRRIRLAEALASEKEKGRFLPGLVEEEPAKEKFRVTLIKDHTLEYEDLWLDVFVVGDRFEEIQFAELFARARCTRAKSLEKADVVIFTGGDDVNPELYGEEPHEATRADPARDDADMGVYVFCLERGIPMIGVCRGAQFLHVMNGGKLYQHVDNHVGDHSIFDLTQNKTLDRVSSSHHQMVRWSEGMEIIATSNKAAHRWLNPKVDHVGVRADIEAYFYRETCCLGVQGHPEYRGYNYFAKWFLEKINEYIVYCPDIERRDGNLRIRKELLEQRDFSTPETPPVDIPLPLPEAIQPTKEIN